MSSPRRKHAAARRTHPVLADLIRRLEEHADAGRIKSPAFIELSLEPGRVAGSLFRQRP